MPEEKETHDRTRAEDKVTRDKEHQKYIQEDAVRDQAQRDAHRSADIIEDKAVRDEERRIERHGLLRWLVPFLIAGALVTIVVAIGALIVAERASNNNAKIEALQKQNHREQSEVDFAQSRAIETTIRSELAQCNRLNEQRSEDNVHAWFQQQADLKLASIIVERGLLNVLNHRDRNERVNAAMQYKRIAQNIRYDPPTNCKQAIGNQHYRRPLPSAFPKNYQPTRVTRR